MDYFTLTSWENPIDVVLALVSINFLFMGLLLSGQGLFYTFTTFLLYFVFTGFIVIKVYQFLYIEGEEKEGDNNGNNYLFVEGQSVKQFYINATNLTVNTYGNLCICNKSILLTLLQLFVLYFVSFVGSLFSLKTLVWAGLNVMFAGALLRGKLQEKVYPLLTTTSKTVSDVMLKVFNRIPKYSKLDSKKQQ